MMRGGKNMRNEPATGKCPRCGLATYFGDEYHIHCGKQEVLSKMIRVLDFVIKEYGVDEP